jgi:hypothetical protein
VVLYTKAADYRLTVMSGPSLEKKEFGNRKLIANNIVLKKPISLPGNWPSLALRQVLKNLS